MATRITALIFFLYRQLSHNCMVALLTACFTSIFTTMTYADAISDRAKSWAERERKYGQINFFPKKKKHNTQQNVGRALYKALDDPARVKRGAASALIYGSLDMVGLDDEVKAVVDYVEDKTEFDFGECGELKIRNELRMETCLNDETSIRFRSDYDMGDIKLEFNWRF